jgi:DNA polymerase-1
MDFASQEVLITACSSSDPVMLSAFQQTPRLDIHSLTASGIAHVLLPRLGVPCSGPVTYEQFLAGLHSEDEKVKGAHKTVRNKYAKRLLFGIIYGSSAVGVAETLLIPKQEAEKLVEALFTLYARVPAWQREVTTYAKEHGYVEMPYGTRRHAIADLWSDDSKKSGRQYRQLGNATIQGAAAEILKVVRQEIFVRNMRERYQMESVFQVYDEITASVPVPLAKDYIAELAEVMRIQAPGFPVALDVEASVGHTWGTQIEVGIPTPDSIDKALKQLEEINMTFEYRTGRNQHDL